MEQELRFWGMLCLLLGLLGGAVLIGGATSDGPWAELFGRGSILLGVLVIFQGMFLWSLLRAGAEVITLLRQIAAR